MDIHLLIKDLTILLLVSLPINILFHKIKLPSVMGFLVAGVIIGPNNLHWVSDSESVKSLAEIGVILLLFVIGLEFSLRRMLENILKVVGVGGLQMAFTFTVIFLIFEWLGFPRNQGIVFGMLCALSSTAIVLKMITDQAEIDTPHGKICIGTLLFQDICVVPMMLIIPLLSHAGEYSPQDFLFAFLKSLTAVGAIFFISRLLVPGTLGAITRLGSKEPVTLFVVLIILGTGWLSQSLGLSLAMGAFIAGMILSDSEYNYQIILDILPLKDYFGSIFFISIGMLLQVQTLFDSFFQYLGLALALISIKAFLALGASLMMKNSFRISFIVGMRLAQVGEFSLLLASLVLEQNIFSEELYQSFLIVSILSILAAPLLIKLSSKWSFQLQSLTGLARENDMAVTEKEKLTGHVIIAGYSLVGSNLSRVLKEINIPFQVLELDGIRVKQALTEKVPILYGDSTHRETLLKAGILDARMIVFSISDYTALEQGVRLARKLNPNIYILVRTRFATQVEALNNAGANQVIPEEFETSIEIFSRVLREYHISNNIIEQQVELIRMEGYSMFRGLSLSAESLEKFSTYLTASLTESFHVLDSSWIKNKNSQDLDLHADTGARLIAVVRDNQLHANPDSTFHFREKDILITFGRHAQLDRTLRIFQSGPESPDS